MLPFDKLYRGWGYAFYLMCYNESFSDLLAAFKALNRLIPISYGFKRRFVASNVFIDKYLPVFHANWVPAGYKLVPAGYKLVPAGYNHPSSSIQGDLRWGLGDFLAECGGPAPAPP